MHLATVTLADDVPGPYLELCLSIRPAANDTECLCCKRFDI